MNAIYIIWIVLALFNAIVSGVNKEWTALMGWLSCSIAVGIIIGIV